MQGMTALSQYQRLEAVGQWRPDAEAPAREVVVSFGEATLVLTDPRSETPLAHWSLPAVTRLSPPGTFPAHYTPGPVPQDAAPGELLELDDPEMIEAIARIHRAIDAVLPHPGRLRRRLGLAALVLGALAAIWWLPGATVSHAIRLAPPAQRATIGDAVLTDLMRLTGPACRRPAGDTVLTRLADRLAPPGAGGTDRARLVVLPGGFSGVRALPGGILAIGPDLIGAEAQLAPVDATPEADYSALTSTRPLPRPDGMSARAPIPETQAPDVLAGAIMAAMQGAAESDPLADVLHHAGFRASLSLLTRGAVSPARLDGFAAKLLPAPPPPQDDEALLARFEAAGVPSTPYARHRDPGGESVLTLIEADPFARTVPPRAILSPAEWQALREICQTP